MKKYTFQKCFLILNLLILISCSDDKVSSNTNNTTKTQTNEVKQIPISHTLLNSSVTATDKQKFENAFAEQCVTRELKNSVNPENDKIRFGRACECIATFMMKDLTAIEAEKFLTEHQNSQSLTIKYENAAYHCLQEKTVQPAHLFSRP